MGITFAKLFQRLFSKKEMRILMVRAVLRSRDQECAFVGPYGLVVFFSIFFFSFRVKIRERRDDGTLHFESRCVERERPGIFLPERGLDATRLRGQKVFDYLRLCLYLSNLSIDRVGLEEKRKRSPNSVRLRGAAKFWFTFTTLRPFFCTRRESSRLLTKFKFCIIFVNATGWSRCRR